ncbi:MAG: ATP/GTP-binding protein [Runella slithyformis]|nr:MAG: ATP/GTP-binding protein [Runella slithyformis]TAF25952.1 MAG: ATP/GTP-binding protein [Runella slithyformis]TAF45086.1 MAG: ATP/GTP-binding protein [Runella slithyformis]TAF80052.1 MAG: ATP/GTP-binding protein [Runella slithyformis]
MKNTLFFLVLFGCYNVSLAQHKLTKIWETDTLLKVPESVLYDGKMLYVTNIEGKEPWGKDGKGSIAKVALDGKIIKNDWITGLNAPKGMGLYKDKLYVADLTEVLVIDVAKSSIVERIKIDDSQALNDITIDTKGVVYVSDSKGKKVYQIKNGIPTLLLENLQSPNGLLAHQDEFYVLDNGGMYQMQKDKTLKLIANGMAGNTDGIVKIDNDHFIVSCWAGAIWLVNANGTKELLQDTQAQKMHTADISYDTKTKILYVPTFWKNTVIAYQFQ